MSKMLTESINRGSVDMFKERLEKARLNSSLKSKEALAKALGINRATITNYETGERKPDIDRFMELADALHVSYDYLLGHSPSTIREYHDTKEITGLSDKAIEALNNLVKETKHKMGSPELAINKIRTLNYLLEQEEKIGFLDRLSDFLWSEYKTEYAEGLDVVKTEDISGNIHLFSLTDLKNIKILEIEILLSKLKENIVAENIVKDNKKKK